jgi:hypothetical protein
MAGVTGLVRQALAELGPGATVKEVTDYVLGKDSRVPKGHVSLAMRNLRLSAEKKRSRTKQPPANPSQRTIDFPE